MIVLGRRAGEQLVIGEGDDAIVVKVVSVDRGTVRVGVEAPGRRVDRYEVRQARNQRSHDGRTTR